MGCSHAKIPGLLSKPLAIILWPTGCMIIFSKEAYQSLAASPFFAQWDLDVLKAYVNYNMKPCADGVALKTTGVQVCQPP